VRVHAAPCLNSRIRGRRVVPGGIKRTSAQPPVTRRGAFVHS